MLQLSSAGKRFGPRILFEDANWLITPDERTGLVGGNGTGKSTLLKILAGLESLDYGTLAARPGHDHRLPAAGRPRALRPQRLRGVPLRLRRAPRHRARARDAHRTRSPNSTRSPPSTQQPPSATPAWIADRFHAHDGYALDAQVGAVLGGLGFSKEDWERQTEEFSGGWQMRIALAKLLLAKPSLLLLDEPTNHLDLETRNWLEDYLHELSQRLHPHLARPLLPRRHRRPRSSRSGTSACTSTTATTRSTWRRRRSAARSSMSAYKQPARAHRAAGGLHQPLPLPGHQGQAGADRIKELEKIERIEVPEEEPAIHFTFPQPPASGRTRGRSPTTSSKSYGRRSRCSRTCSFTIERGDRIALVGVNGAGKSR